MSRRTSAHVATVFEMDMTKIAEMRGQLQTAVRGARRRQADLHAVIIKAVVESLKAFPILNASVEGDNVVYKQDINIGIAGRAIEWGLIVPLSRAPTSSACWGSHAR